MALLANFPIVSQLTSITSDGRLSENAQFDCVAASIGACILWYEGKTQWDVDINPDRLKDAAYGEALHNSGTSATAYIDFCKSLGYKLYSVTEPDRLSAVKTAHSYIERDIPVIFTEDDPYADASLGWTHVCVWYGDDANGLTALDPYIAKPIYRSDASWANLLRSNQIWIVEKEQVVIAYNTPGVSHFFTETDPQHWRCLGNGQPNDQTSGKIVQFAILDFYKRFGGNALCGLTWLGLPMSNEIPLVGSQHGAVRQHFEDGVVFWDPAHEFDARPGIDTPVYLAKLYQGQGQDPAIAHLQAELAAAQKPTITGIDPAHVASFQQARAADAQKLRDGAQALATALLVPVQ